MADISTLRIMCEEHESGFKVINECDFDPKMHKLFDEENDGTIEINILELAERVEALGGDVDQDLLLEEIEAAKEDGTLKKLRGKFKAMVTKREKE